MVFQGKIFTAKLDLGKVTPILPLFLCWQLIFSNPSSTKSKERGILSLPLDLQHSTDYPIVQYVDDTLIIMEASARHSHHLKGLVQSFGTSTGLKVNYSKSMMVPINLSEQKLDRLAMNLQFLERQPSLYIPGAALAR